MARAIDRFVVLSALALAATFASSARAAAQRTPVTAEGSAFNGDLELVTRIVGTPPKHSWWPLEIDVDIVNRSTTTSHPIVLPGDGSSAGWREPHARFSAEVQAEDGTWRTLPIREVGRCGLYDANWLDEVVRLAPGAAQRLAWMGTLPELPEQGRVRIRAHYAYKATPSLRDYEDRDPIPPPEGLGGMAGVAPFELVSAPIELLLEAPDCARSQIESDLALELTRADSKPAYSWDPQRLDARIVNRSSSRTHRVVRPVFTRNPSGDEPGVVPSVEVERSGGAWWPAYPLGGGFYDDGPIDAHVTAPPQLDWRVRVVELAPGQSVDFELPASRLLYDFKDSSAARVSVSYGFRGLPIRDESNRALPAPAALGEMVSTPPFCLASNKVAWPVSSPLELEITLRTDRDPRSAPTLANSLRVVLRNRGDESIEISSAQRPAKFAVSADGLMRAEGPAFARCELVLPPLVIAPHTELSLLDDPSIGACAPERTRPSSKDARGSLRAEALLRRPGWIHASRASWPFRGN